MSIKSQQAKMKQLATLLEGNLSYIYGEKECGPNGAKVEFHRHGKAFLRGMAKDLAFTDFIVRSNTAGIATSGEVSLYGLWDNEGLMITLSQFDLHNDVMLYRTITQIKGGQHGFNQWLPLNALSGGDYTQLLATFSHYQGRCRHAA
ncbi:hypothetical protein RFF05_13965 [Bengtsoniella intestinalis]|uniref:hypothetical protein n=1 Tax=Bengtsoniella intestinalis TaxID=3073143 RepID=UPI00391F6AE0